MPVQFRRRDALRGTETERRITSALQDGWKDLGGKLVRYLRGKSPVYRGRFKASHKFKTRGTGLRTVLVVYSSDKLGAYKDRGREAGKFPPPDDMLAYVRKRGLGRFQRISFSKKSGRLVRSSRSKMTITSVQKGIAFLIGRKLSKGNINSKRPNLYSKVLDDNRATIAGGIKRLSSKIAEMLSR